MIAEKNRLHRIYQLDPSSAAKKTAFTKIGRTVQTRLCTMQDSWLAAKADEIQKYADTHDSNCFYDALIAVYGQQSSSTSPLLNVVVVVVVVVVCFYDLKFCLSSQLKAASCAWCNSEMPPSKQVNGHSITICLIVWCPPQSQSSEAMFTHSCMLLRHGPASDRNRFSGLHWPRGRSIPGSWMVGSLINELFGTSTICHRVRQRCWMVGASSGRLDHIGRLNFCRGWGESQYR